jgi:hypothetical protein
MLSLILLTIITLAQPEDINLLVKMNTLNFNKELSQKLESQETELQKATVSRNQSKINFIEHQISETKAKILKYKYEPYFGQLKLPPKVGNFGTLNNPVVTHVVDKNIILIEARYVDERLPLLDKNRTQKITFMIKDIKKEDFQPEQVFKVVGTQNYQTISDGYDSIWVLEVLDVRKIKEFYE